MGTRDADAIAQRSLRAIDGLSADMLRDYNAAMQRAMGEQSKKLAAAIKAGDRTWVERELRTLGEMTAVAGEQYEENFQKLLNQTYGDGYRLADDLVAAYDPNSLSGAVANVNFEAVAAQTRDGARRLRNHSQEMIKNIQAIATQSLAEGTGPKILAQRLSGQLGIIKSRAENIARTETMSALNASTTERYERYGVTHVQLSAAMDNRTTPECQMRHMKIIRIEESQPPYHFQCRTVALPVKREWLTDADIAFAEKEYAKAGEGALNRATIFEKLNGIKPPAILTVGDFRGTKPKPPTQAKKRAPSKKKATTPKTPTTKPPTTKPPTTKPPTTKPPTTKPPQPSTPRPAVTTQPQTLTARWEDADMGIQFRGDPTSPNIKGTVRIVETPDGKLEFKGVPSMDRLPASQRQVARFSEIDRITPELERQASRVVDRRSEIGRASELRMRGVIRTQREFDNEMAEAISRIQDHNALMGRPSADVQINQVRSALGDRISRTEFDDRLAKMVESDKATLMAGEMSGITPEKKSDSFNTPDGLFRYYIRM